MSAVAETSRPPTEGARHYGGTEFDAEHVFAWDLLAVASQQRREVLLEELRKIRERTDGVLFVDEDFPASARSLGGLFSDSIDWCRFSSPLFGSSAVSSAVSIEQGRLDNCWLLGALTSVWNTRPEYIRAIVDGSFLEAGAVLVRCFKGGYWRECVVDTLLPRDAAGELLFARCSDGSSWAPFIEKAWAKMHCSFAALERGTEAEALSDLTAGLSEILDLKDLATRSCLADGSLRRRLLSLLCPEGRGIVGCANVCLEALDEAIRGTEVIKATIQLDQNRPAVPLRFEVESDPRQIAADFVTKHQLGECNIPPIVDFVRSHQEKAKNFCKEKHSTDFRVDRPARTGAVLENHSYAVVRIEEDVGSVSCASEDKESICVHKLCEGAATGDGFACDECDIGIPNGESAYSCRICNYDQCAECFHQPSRSATHLTLVNPWGNGVPSVGEPIACWPGFFRVSWTHFLAHYNALHICELTAAPAMQPVALRARGAWRATDGSAGGRRGLETFPQNPRFRAALRVKSSVTFLVEQSEARCYGQPNRFAPLGLFVKGPQGKSSTFVTARQQLLSLTLDPGVFEVVPMTWESGQEANFQVSLFARDSAGAYVADLDVLHSMAEFSRMRRLDTTTQ
eukprot:TRINITY_DN27217_c0_g1_i1.p1 TRINITY_DN27217_c0_g1~~TRINITY_DN27217_c0_g1_i1.p1  ORF type:complete len:627 (+),score=101.46 TRINITY_DN27217_c0_g1_i1:171-2051(+)